MQFPPFWQQTPQKERKTAFLSLLLPGISLLLFLAARFFGLTWTIRREIDYIPKEIRLDAFEIPSDLVEFSLALPHYIFAGSYSLRQVLPPDWIYLPVVLIFILSFSLLAVGISYLEGLWLYCCLAACALGVALFEPGLLSPAGLSGNWLSGVFVLLVLLPVFWVSRWMPSMASMRRWLLFLLFYGLLSLLFFSRGFSVASASGMLAALCFPMLVSAVFFILLNAGDAIQGLLFLLTRAQGNAQSLFHFSVFSLSYLLLFLLTYLRNTGQLSLDIFYPEPLFLQVLTMIAGFWLIPQKSGLNTSPGFLKAYGFLFPALASLFFLTCFVAYGTGNDLMTEVLDDAVTLIHFCIGLCFFLYVLINFSDLMRLGLRVHEVVFRPRYMPVTGILVFGLAGVFIFLLNSNYFPLEQAMAARYVYWGDHARAEGNALLSGEMYRQALSYESRNQRANLSLAALYLESGSPDKAFAAATASMEKNPVPEAVLLLAQIHRSRNQVLEEILCLREGLRKFPENSFLLNNAGVAFSSTIFTDSAFHYLQRASAASETAELAAANLDFLRLLKPDGVKGRDTGNRESENWMARNNRLVASSKAGRAATEPDAVLKKFAEIPEELRPYLLYHSLLNKAIVQDTSRMNAFLALQDDSIRKYYSEAIGLGEALLRFRGNEKFRGLTQLLNLYATASSNRRDLGLLLGQLYFAEGAYQTAAGYFRDAAQAGQKEAWYWYAIAMLDAGKGREAAIAFREALAVLPDPEKAPVARLIASLEMSEGDSLSLQTDAEKSAFIKTRWNQLEDSQIKGLISLSSNPGSARLLWQYCFRRAYRESRRQRCSELYAMAASLFQGGTKEEEIPAEISRSMEEISGNAHVLEKEKESLPAYFRALLADRRGQTREALNFYRQAVLENPLHTRQVTQAVQRIAQLGSAEKAYQLALDVNNLEPSSAEFLRLYARIALQMGLADFAFQCLPRYRLLSSDAEADSLRAEMTASLKARNLPVPDPPSP